MAICKRESMLMRRRRELSRMESESTEHSESAAPRACNLPPLGPSLRPSVLDVSRQGSGPIVPGPGSVRRVPAPGLPGRGDPCCRMSLRALGAALADFRLPVHLRRESGVGRAGCPLLAVTPTPQRDEGRARSSRAARPRPLHFPPSAAPDPGLCNSWRPAG